MATTVYKYIGNKSRQAGMDRFQAYDSNGIIRLVKIGDTISLTDAQRDALSKYVALDSNLGSATPAAPISAPVVITQDPDDGDVPIWNEAVGDWEPGPQTGSGGSSINFTGLPWTNQAWSKGDAVTWLGSSFVAKNNIAVGGSNPNVDTANWMTLARGGGEIACAEYYAPTGGYAVPPASTDLPGALITVPGGVGPYELFVQIPWEITATAVNGAGICSAFAYDIDNAVNVGNAGFRIQIPVSGQIAFNVTTFTKRMPASPTPRNFKVMTGLVLASATVKIRSDGPSPSNMSNATAMIQAKAL